MILPVDGAVYRGRAVTVRTDVDPETIAEAVRKEDADEDGTVTVRARQPHPVHERVGCIHPVMGLRARTALADAARARGLSTAHDPALRAARERLREVSVTGVDTTDQRRAVADASSETERLRERVAETRGRLAARREFDRETDALAAELEDAARELSEAETSAGGRTATHVASWTARCASKTSSRTAGGGHARRWSSRRGAPTNGPWLRHQAGRTNRPIPSRWIP